jgi:hypothetical protein
MIAIPPLVGYRIRLIDLFKISLFLIPSAGVWRFFMAKPSRAELREALSAASSAHHEFEQNFLKGERDEYWAGWYAAFVIGRLGEFTTPTKLTKWLQEANGEGEWAKIAADHLLKKLH